MYDDLEYFRVINNHDNIIVFFPKDIIKDILYEPSKNIIPFSNGNTYYVYQDIVLKIVDYFEYINYNISISINDNKHIVLSNYYIHDTDIIIKNVSKMITIYINKKFSLWC